MKTQYDVVFVGAGISSAYTLIHLVSNWEKQDRHQPVLVGVLEQTGEFWPGVPYGKKSGKNPLIITSIKEFIPQQPEREHFIEWLKENYESLFNVPEQKNGRLTTKWQESHKEAIAEGRWDDLFVPRFVFGSYIQEYVKEVTGKAIANGVIQMDLIAATVQDIEPVESGYSIEIALNDQMKSLSASKVILGIGSPPNTHFGKLGRHYSTYISDIYEPSMDENLEKAYLALSGLDPGKRTVLIVGSNASTLDMLFALNNSAKVSEIIDRFVVISPNAAFPHRISKVFVDPGFVAKNLAALNTKDSFVASEILDAVKADVAEADSLKLNIADIFPEISRKMLETVDKLSLKEQKRFVAKYAVEIGKMQRRAGGEYLDVVDELTSSGKFSFVKGRFIGYLAPEEGGPGIEYIDGDTGQTKILTESIGLVINCAGFQPVDNSSSALMQNLIRREICTVNDSNRGFLLNERFETSPDFYLMGPLVAGNLNQSLRVWHAESCSRIIQMSKKLADVIAADF